MDELMELVGKVWPIRFTGTGNIRFAWRGDKLHSIACFGNGSPGQGVTRVTVNSADWRDLRDASDLFHVPAAVYAADGDGVVYATWPVQTVMKYELTPDPTGALVVLPRMEFKKIEGKS